jgi:hypothetical protein
MNITNRYCELSTLTQTQIDKLRVLMPVGRFDFFESETVLGFRDGGRVGTWSQCASDIIISYKQMVALLTGEEEEKEVELVPHVHQKEIIAWANGEKIELLLSSILYSEWVFVPSPTWLAGSSYRIKPEPTPTQLRIQELTEELVKLKEQHNVECGIDKVMGK